MLLIWHGAFLPSSLPPFVATGASSAQHHGRSVAALHRTAWCGAWFCSSIIINAVAIVILFRSSLRSLWNKSGCKYLITVMGPLTGCHGGSSIPLSLMALFWWPWKVLSHQSHLVVFPGAVLQPSICQELRQYNFGGRFNQNIDDACVFTHCANPNAAARGAAVASSAPCLPGSGLCSVPQRCLPRNGRSLREVSAHSASLKSAFVLKAPAIFISSFLNEFAVL